MSTEEKLAPAAWRRPSIIDRAQWSYSTHEPAAWSEREALYDEATVSRLSAEVQELREALSDILRCEYESAEPGLTDCIDNDGKPYQSDYLDKCLKRAEALLAALKPETVNG